MTHFLVTITAVVDTISDNEDNAAYEILGHLNRSGRVIGFMNPSVKVEKVNEVSA